jgi:hypothetical protein
MDVPDFLDEKIDIFYEFISPIQRRCNTTKVALIGQTGPGILKKTVFIQALLK